MPPLRALSLPPIATFSPSNNSSPAPEGSTPTPDDTPNDLAHLRALRLRRFAPAAPASVVAQPSTSASVAASVPAPALVVAPSIPAPALVVAPPPDSPAVAPLVISHISAVFPSSAGAVQEAAPPRLFIRLPARSRAASPQLPSTLSAPAVVASPATQPTPVPAVSSAPLTYTTYAPDFLEYSTDPTVVPPGRNTYPVEQRRLYDALWRAGHFDQVPYGWCPQDEWTAFRLDFWPTLYEIRAGAVPRPMARGPSIVPFVYVDLWRPSPFVVENEREVSLEPSSSGDWLLPIARNPLGFVNQWIPFEAGPDLDSPVTADVRMSPASVSPASDASDSNSLLEPIGGDFDDEQMSAESRDREVTPDLSPSASPISRAVSCEESFPSPFFGITDVQALRSPTPMALGFDDDLLDFSERFSASHVSLEGPIVSPEAAAQEDAARDAAVDGRRKAVGLPSAPSASESSPSVLARPTSPPTVANPRASPIRTRSGRALATAPVGTDPADPASDEDRGRPLKRRRGKGDKSGTSSAQRTGDKSRSRKRRRKQAEVEMAGPIPLLQDTHHQRNVPEPFAETIAPPPIDVDGLSQVVDHPALKERGGCERCQLRRIPCDQSELGVQCTPCIKSKQRCTNVWPVEERMLLTNFLGARLELNRQVARWLELGETAMRLLESARSIFDLFSQQGNEIIDTLEGLEAHYGDTTGLAHAAEIPEGRRDEFAELISQVRDALPTRPSTSANNGRQSRARWPREFFAPYRAVDDELDRALASRAGGDAGQGTSQGVTRDESEERELTPKPSDEGSSSHTPERSPSPKLSKAAGKRRATGKRR
ncbi:hypothetical protein GGX14DRAFT_402586 [Mycena pura]|uniref:Zn(2)-C6 fungal-type domain-containing protein n=1 Tax=Mycena pura TaxID=153505 RepID=A0AAD6V4U5_9AGAR|nr:hypothetical protein GGX14DRAFT_402586 [Mycena pura]